MYEPRIILDHRKGIVFMPLCIMSYNILPGDDDRLSLMQESLV